VTLPARRYRRIRITARTATLAVVPLLSVLAGADVPALAHNADSAHGDASPRATPATTTWLARLVPTGDSTNVRVDAGGLRLGANRTGPASIRSGRPEGMLLTAVHPLAAPSSQVIAELAADQPAGSTVAVDVRGTRADGSWTEWTTTGATAPARPGPGRLSPGRLGPGRLGPAMLDAAVTSVQARIVLRAGKDKVSPLVRSVRLTAQPGSQVLVTHPRRPSTYRVFATREGLVGSSTANGHVIHERDHFVALPSRRGLAPRDSGDYTVKICASTDRCEWAPVWDVGPWNTTDDYWNPSGVRQSWTDLPQGRPQADAAYDDDYHDGQDQFGRQVLNPAGIDLADGTFQDGLQLHDNSWVTVTYLWTEGPSPAIVQIPILPVHSGPGEQYPTVGLAAQRAKLSVECAVAGQFVTGSQGRTNRWLRIGPRQFIPAAHVSLQAVQQVAQQRGVQQGPVQRCATP
jgi:hypothetical protein